MTNIMNEGIYAGGGQLRILPEVPGGIEQRMRVSSLSSAMAKIMHERIRARSRNVGIS
jgi:hypothetical protein